MIKMSFIELARNRKSIRVYHPRCVPDEEIKELLEAARLAPSGCNAQPWEYVVIKDRYKIHQLVDEGIYWQEFVANAPILIIGCANPSKYLTDREEIKFQMGKGIQPKGADKLIQKIFKEEELCRATRDVAISMMYIVYRAEELGLSSCFVGSFYREKLKEFLQLPKYLEPTLSLTVGYAAESPQVRPRKSLEEITYKII